MRIPVCSLAVVPVLLLTTCAAAFGQAAKTKSGDAPASPSAAPATTTRSAARRMKSLVRVQLSKKTLRYTLDSESGDSLGQLLDGATFDTLLPINVVYPRLNPLKVQASASVAAVDDPRAATIAKLIDGLSAIPSIVKPDSGAGAGPTTKSLKMLSGACPAYTEATKTVQAIEGNLFTSYATADSLGKAFKDWQNAIQHDLDQKLPGAVAVQSGVSAINGYASNLDTAIANAESALKDVDKHLATSTVTTPERAAYQAFLDNLLTPLGGDQKKIDETKARYKAQLDALSTKADDADECTTETQTLYALVRLTNPESRLGQLRQLRKTIGDLAKTLTDSYGAEAWENDNDYVLTLDVTPTSDKAEEVTIKVVAIDATVADGSFQTTQTDAATAKFTVERYTSFTPEIGVGATFGFVTRPKYGTGKNAAGETVVTAAGQDRVSVDPTVMVNFVPTGISGAAPFIQLGASASKTSPAVFVGGGWKVPGTASDKGIAVGLGLMLAWVKDLQTLQINSVVTGTSQIDADMAFDPQPRPRFYFNLQYKF